MIKNQTIKAYYKFVVFYGLSLQRDKSRTTAMAYLSSLITG
jgi:hypothetical protein